MKSTYFGVTNIYLINILKKVNVPFFKGIYSANTIPSLSTLGNTFCIIINTSPSFKNGEHWLVLTRFKGKQVKIIDSLNIPFMQMTTKMRNFLKKNEATPLRNFSIQSITSVNCGFYCLHAILLFHCKLEKKTTCKIIPFKKKSTPVNDEICTLNLEKMIRIMAK